MLERAHWRRLLARTSGWTPADYVPLRVALGADEKQRHAQRDELLIGWVRKDQQDGLTRFSDFFRVDDAAVLIHTPYATVADRSAAFLVMSETLRDEGAFPQWQQEQYQATRAFGAAPLFHFHRGSGMRFGLSGFATHLNGYTRDTTSGRVDSVWIAMRSTKKKYMPGLLDTIVGGGLPAHITAHENMVKESQEEAGLAPQWTRERLVSTGSISYVQGTRSGLDCNTMFIYDVEMPKDMTPQNQDNEVEWFERWRVDDVVAALRDEPERFKPDICLVLLDFLIRHGVLTPDNFADLAKLERALRSAPSPFDERLVGCDERLAM